MGWFSNPKCPYCGGDLTRTGYSFPYPQWRCRSCIRKNSEKKALKDEIEDLKNRLSKAGL